MKRALDEWGAAPPTHPEPVTGNVWSPATADREQLGSLAQPDKEAEPEELPPHLRDYELGGGDEDDLGPVPPGNEDARVSQDPFTRGWSALPTPHISRG